MTGDHLEELKGKLGTDLADRVSQLYAAAKVTREDIDNLVEVGIVAEETAHRKDLLLLRSRSLARHVSWDDDVTGEEGHPDDCPGCAWERDVDAELSAVKQCCKDKSCQWSQVKEMTKPELFEALVHAEEELCWYRSRVEGAWPNDRLVSVPVDVTPEHVRSLLAEPLVPRLSRQPWGDHD